MRKLFYFTIATLSVIGLTFELVNMLSSAESTTSNWSSPDLWYSVITRLIGACAIVAFIILVLLQLKKPTPRSIMFISGFVLNQSLLMLLSKQWYGLAFLIAGSLTLFVELFDATNRAKQVQKIQDRYRMLLVTSAILAFLAAGINIATMVSGWVLLLGLAADYPLSVYLWICGVNLPALIWNICLGLYCLNTKWRMNALIRTLLYAPYAIGLVFLPAWIVFASISNFIPVFSYAIECIGTMLGILMLIHTYKTRKESLTPDHGSLEPQADVSILN